MLTFLLFFHILAVCGLVGGMALGLSGLIHLHRAQTFADARTALFHGRIVGAVMRPSAVLLLVTGIAMVTAAALAGRPGTLRPW